MKVPELVMYSHMHVYGCSALYLSNAIASLVAISMFLDALKSLGTIIWPEAKRS